MKIDQILTLIDEFEKAVERHSSEIDCGWVVADMQKAEKELEESKARLIEAVKKALK